MLMLTLIPNDEKHLDETISLDSLANYLYKISSRCFGS